ncbi:MAG TPA: hypothetical protein VM099_08175 [Gemmatimonadaceae bacterium]|nr:hypothetical protein [Gemmatimonadaceae bacterium]
MKTAFVRNFRFAPAFLLLAYTNCGGDGKSSGPAEATAIAANSAATITAVAGTPVTPPPSVIVRDQNGDPFGGAAVTFSVVSGGGTIIGGSAVTDASGVATVGGWTLGKTAGANVLTATSGTLSVTFNATGTVGPAAVMVVSSGENQIGTAGAALSTSPSVMVQDANGNPRAGAVVTFTPATGGGSVTGGTATSNAAGIASVGSWTLGPQSGGQTLVASTTGVPAITFHAIASSAKCGQRTTHVLGSTSNGTLESDDCQFSDGTFVDFFSTTTAGPSNTYLFRQTAAFDTYLDLRSADGSVIAENDDEADNVSNSSIKILLPADTYVLGAGSFEKLTLGNYQLSSQVVSQNNSKCELYFAVKNVSTTQNIETTDCLLPGTPSPLYADGFFILLRAGQSITINMTSSVVDPFLDLVRQSGVRVAQNDNKDATTTNAQIVFTATVTDYYAIFARTALPSQTGSYTLSIQ